MKEGSIMAARIAVGLVFAAAASGKIIFGSSLAEETIADFVAVLGLSMDVEQARVVSYFAIWLEGVVAIGIFLDAFIRPIYLVAAMLLTSWVAVRIVSPPVKCGCFGNAIASNSTSEIAVIVVCAVGMGILWPRLQWNGRIIWRQK